METDQILKGAEVFRSTSHDVLSDERERARLVADVSALLAAAEPGGDAARFAANRIVELLRERDDTREWFRRYLERWDAPKFPTAARAFDGLAGFENPVSAQKFTCPHGDHEWFQDTVGAPIPLCPTHHTPLEPA